MLALVTCGAIDTLDAQPDAPDRRPLVYVANTRDDSVSIVDGITHKLLKTIRLGDPVGGNQLAFSPSGAIAYIADTDHDVVRVFDTQQRRWIASVDVQRPRSVVFAPKGDSAYVVSATRSGDALAIVDATRHTLRRILTLGGRASLALNDDGSRLAAHCENRDGSATLFAIDTATQTVLSADTARPGLHSLFFGAGGTELYLLGTTDNIWKGAPVVSDIEVLDIATRNRKRRIAVSNGTAVARVSPDKRSLYVGAGDDSIQVIDLSTGTVLGVVHIGMPIQDVAFSIDGARLFLMSPNAITVADVKKRTVTGSVRLPRSPLEVIASPDGEHVYVRTSAATLTVLRVAPAADLKQPSDISVEAALSLDQTPMDLQLQPAVAALYALSPTGVAIIDTHDQRVAQTLVDAQPRQLVSDATRNLLYVAEGNRGTIDIIDLASGQVRFTVPALQIQSGHALLSGVAIAQSADWLFATYRDIGGINGWIAVIDAQSHAILESIPLFGDVERAGPSAAIATPDGQTLYVVFDGGSIGVLDLPSRRLRERIRIAGDSEYLDIRDIAIRKDGTELFVLLHNYYGTHRFLRIDTATLRFTASVNLPDVTPFALAIAADERTAFVTQSDPRELRITAIDLDSNALSATIELPGTNQSPTWHDAALSLSADGSLAYVARGSENQVVSVDLKTGKIMHATPVGRSPCSIISVDAAAR